MGLLLCVWADLIVLIIVAYTMSVGLEYFIVLCIVGTFAIVSFMIYIFKQCFAKVMFEIVQSCYFC